MASSGRSGRAPSSSHPSRSVWDAWRRFWFEPSDGRPLSAARIGIAAVAGWHLLGFAWDVVLWFGPHGLLPAPAVAEILRYSEVPTYRLSPLFLTTSPSVLLAWTLVGAAASLALLLGIGTRVAASITWISVTGLVHRGPVLSGPLEAFLTPLLFYLICSPSGAYWSWDARRRQAPAIPSSGATLGKRLIQVHLVVVCLGLALAKQASLAWRDGTGIWWLTSWREVALIDWTFLHAHGNAFHIWSHAALAFEFAFPVLVWVRSWRPIMLVLACVHWLLFATLSGLTGFCALMVLASAVFLTSDGQRLRLS